MSEPVLARIRDYLASGGLFNPELMEHEKVRDLLMACAKCIKELQEDNLLDKSAFGGVIRANDELRADKDRIDWLEQQRKIKFSGVNLTAFFSKDNDLRQAIDAARNK